MGEGGGRGDGINPTASTVKNRGQGYRLGINSKYEVPEKKKKKNTTTTPLPRSHPFLFLWLHKGDGKKKTSVIRFPGSDSGKIREQRL